MTDVLKRSQQDNQQAGYNYIINGDFRVNQRTTNVTGNAPFIRDRWKIRGPGLTGGKTSVQNIQVIPTKQQSNWDNGYIIVRCENYTSYGYIQQRIESNQIALDKTYTISALVQIPKGNMASIGAFIVTPSDPNNLHQVGSLKNFEYKADPRVLEHTIDFKDREYEITGIEVVVYVMIFFAKENLGLTDFNQLEAPVFVNDGLVLDTVPTFRISNCKFEKGNTATRYEVKNYQQELELCKRYYQVVTGTLRGYTVPSGGDPTLSGSINFPVTMRVTPSATIAQNASGNVSNPVPRTSIQKVDAKSLRWDIVSTATSSATIYNIEQDFILDAEL